MKEENKRQHKSENGGNSKQMSSVFSRLEFKLGVLAMNTFNMPVYPCILNSSEKINHVISERR